MRKIILLCLGITAVIAGLVIYRGSGRITQLEATSAALGRTARHVLKANQDMDDAVESLTRYLLDVQTHEGAPASYAEWSQQQQQARDAVKRLRQCLVDLDEVAVAPDTAELALAASLSPLRPLVTALDQRWFAYDEQGSGLTPHSRAYAIGTLLPLVATDLKLAVTALRGLHAGQWSQKIAGVAAQEAAARRTRLFACLGLVLVAGAAAFVVAYPVPGMRRFRPHTPAIPFARLALDPPQSTPRSTPNFAKLATDRAEGGSEILIVADAPDLREMLSLLVATGGYSVVTCKNVAEARAAIQAIHFDLIVLDREMTGPGSLEILAEIRRQLPALKAIFVADAPDAAGAEELSEHGVAAVVSKRPDPRALLSKISEALTGTPIPFPATYDAEELEKREKRETKVTKAATTEPQSPLGAGNSAPAAVVEPPPPSQPERPPAPPPAIERPSLIRLTKPPEPMAPPKPPPPPEESKPPELVASLEPGGPADSANPSSEQSRRPRLKRRSAEKTEGSPPGDEGSAAGA